MNSSFKTYPQLFWKLLLLYIFSRLADLVAVQRAATKENVQRKQARTDGERDDSENDESDEESPDEGEDDVPYNPKNLPLGWDGKVNHFLIC